MFEPGTRAMMAFRRTPFGDSKVRTPVTIRSVMRLGRSRGPNGYIITAMVQTDSGEWHWVHRANLEPLRG